MIASMNYKERLVKIMELKVGDIVEFKNYEDMKYDERMMIGKDFFPKSGKVKKINVNGFDEFFNIVGNPCAFSKGSVARVISDVDINSLNKGDEVLLKAKIVEIKGDYVLIPWVDKSDIVKILKHNEPEHFIVKEDNYGMYVYGLGVLISNKDDAKIYSSRNEANEAAADMHLNAWDVIPYDD